jgi:octaprenyl-diphosphate synthase
MSHFEMDSTSTLSARGTDREHHSSNGPTPATLPNSDNGKQERAAQHSPLRKNVSAKEVMLRLSEPVAAELMEVEIRLGRELQSPHDELTDILQHGTQIGGKRLRPALVLLTGSAVGSLSNDHIVLGSVVEMVHTATLIHDDVLDDAETRRHVATINARWDEHTSILVGDYLFAQSFRLAATLKSTEACRLVGEAARLVCEGELRQVLSRDILSISEQDYFSMIRGKTAELCRVACELGAKYSGGSSAIVDSMGQYGDSLGVAFQIADDFLDIWGDDATVGKTLGTDIGQGKMTLPLIRLRDTVSRTEWQRISEILTGPVEERLPAIMPFLERSDARSYTQRVAESFKRRAVKSLNCIPSSEARQSLSQLASFSVDRRC